MSITTQFGTVEQKEISSQKDYVFASMSMLVEENPSKQSIERINNYIAKNPTTTSPSAAFRMSRYNNVDNAPAPSPAPARAAGTTVKIGSGK